MNSHNTPLIILIALLGLIILGGSAFAIYMATSNKATNTTTTQASLAASPTAKALTSSTTPTASAATNDSTDAGLDADLSKSNKDIDAVSSDSAEVDSGLNDSQTDLSE
jgi:hypothetical protein